METYAGTRGPVAVERHRRDRLGGTEGNEALTVAAAVALTLLLAAEGITLLKMDSLLSVHMIIGLVLIPPVLLKIGSTGYRFARYYTHSRPYVDKGAPPMALRLLAPVLVLTTVGIFVTGALLLSLGHKSDQLLFLHKASFIVWAGAFGIHFLWHLPHMVRSLPDYRSGARTRQVPGSGLRGVLVAASLGAGVALAISLAGAISGWHGGPPG
jgi:hypothetical protein